VKVDCCIAGAGPAGMVLGLLLARAGVEVLVLEKHADFLRDFRGDTIHPSTLEVIHELDLLHEFLERPHQRITEVRAWIGDEEVTVADLSHLPTHCRFIALMPQWDFLDFVASAARRYPTFRLEMQAEVTGLLEQDGRVLGVRAVMPHGPIEVHADLTVGADGRGSTVRRLADLPVVDLGSPIDVLWFRISRKPVDRPSALGRIDRGRIMVMLPRGDYWQCGFVIHKGGIEETRQRGIESFRSDVASMTPFLAGRVHELDTWDDVKLLTVRVDRLRRWYRPGLLCIGDAAHAMSPVGGIGINLAVQDAVAAANRLAEPLRRRTLTPKDLRRVQRRRELPTRMTQALQLFVQNRIISQALGATAPSSPPWPVRLIDRWPWLRRLPAYFLGIGFRPEHVKEPEFSGRDRTQH
jgi:2-polyprenyl-6-methoxyphenol hydroxylase-like FAD-dependent oxidoreductase